MTKGASVFGDTAPRFARNANLIAVGVALVVLVMTIVAVASRPKGTDWSSWRPATGVAIGVAGWYPPRHAWLIAIGATLGSILGSMIAGRSLPIAVGGGIVAGLEAWIGSRILRGRTGRIPSISSWGGLRRLLVAAMSVGLVTATGLGATSFLVHGAEQVLPTLVAATTPHMLGMLLVAPVFFAAPSAMQPVSVLEQVVQWAALAVVIAITFVLTTGLPIAFLTMLPLVWGANRLPYRAFVAQLFLTSLAISEFTALAFGPFGSEAIATEARTLLSGVFGISVSVLVFTIIASAAVARNAQAALDASERFGRELIAVSLTGVAVLDEADGALRISEINPAGRGILALESEGSVDVVDLFTDDDALALREAFERTADDELVAWSTASAMTRSGRVLEASLVPLSGLSQSRTAFQFIDVTDRELVRAQNSAERKRAIDTQAALVPRDSLLFPGYQIAGRSMASKELGGDFYDWYSIAGGFALTLGDVMGKGTGASIFAAALRTSLRVAGEELTPAAAVARVAGVTEFELSTASTFSTVFAAHIRAKDGRVQYVDAGHGLALLCRADGSLTQLRSRDLPVGMLADSRWESKSARLDLDDTLIVFSDGVLDLFDGSLMALDEVARMARAAVSSEDLIERIFSMVDPDSLDDDVTAVAIRRVVS